ncbi:MAG: DNA repair protein RecO [Anaerolineae bacterium]
MRQARERLYRTEAIVLKRQDFGEADRLLTILTRERGKLRVIAKGARRTSSRKAGHVELFSQSQLLLAKGRNMDLVTQAQAVTSHPSLYTDLLRYTYASYMAELVDKFLEEEDPHGEVYDLLRESLAALVADGSDAQLALLMRFYELRLLGLVGFQPSLFHCAHCQSPLAAEDQYFSAMAGGALCPNCRSLEADVVPLPLTTLKVARFIQTRDYPQVRTIALSPDVHRDLERLLLRYLTHVLERQLKSVEFLDQVRNLSLGTSENDVLLHNKRNGSASISETGVD